jgi:hypothetical protein
MLTVTFSATLSTFYYAYVLLKKRSKVLLQIILKLVLLLLNKSL